MPVELSPQRRRLLCAASLATASALAGTGCAGGGSSPSPAPPPGPVPTRTYKMGFTSLPPKLDVATVIAGIDRWSTRAELATIHEELPWRDLLVNGMTPDAILDRDKVQLVQYFRGKGLQLYFMADLTDGLSRADEAPQLRAIGRSLQEASVQRA